MFRVSKLDLRICVICVGLLFFAPCMCVFAADGETIDASINVTGKVETPNSLKVIAGEQINDASGKAVLEKDEDAGLAFEKRAGGYSTHGTLYKNVKYYVTDDVSKVLFVAETDNIVVSFDGSVSQQSSEPRKDEDEKKKADNKKIEGDKEEEISVLSAESTEVETDSGNSEVLDLKTKEPSSTAKGKTVKYVIDSLAGAKDKVSDAFLLQVDVPSGMTLEKVYCGTYNKEVRMQLVCQTEKDGEWHSWYEDLSSTSGNVCDTSSISLAEGDRICAFALSCDQVPEGFEMNKDDPLYYTMNVVGDSADTSAAGKAKLTAYVDGKKESSDSESILEIAAQEIIQTGDDNFLFIGSMIMMIVSLATMFTYITIRIILYKKEEKIASGKAPEVVFSRERGKQTNEKMSSLIQKRGG